jgi:hypothetical protein
VLGEEAPPVLREALDGHAAGALHHGYGRRWHYGTDRLLNLVLDARPCVGAIDPEAHCALRGGDVTIAEIGAKQVAVGLAQCAVMAPWARCSVARTRFPAITSTPMPDRALRYAGRLGDLASRDTRSAQGQDLVDRALRVHTSSIRSRTDSLGCGQMAASFCARVPTRPRRSSLPLRVGAPGAIRTHTERDLNPLPLPLGYGG